MTDLLNTIIASEKRRNLLLLLYNRTYSWDEIKSLLDVSATGMLPQIKILENECLLERNGRDFSLTPLGKMLVRHMAPFSRAVDTISTNKKFWQEHAIGELPPDLLAEISDLGNYQIMENSDEEIFDINNFLNNIAGAQTIKGISHTVHPKYPSFFLNLAKRGTRASLILTPGVFKIMREKYRDALEEGLKINTSSLYISRNDIKFSYIVTESYFSISLFYNNGIFDSKNDVISRDPSALAWGERLFSHYQSLSDRVESLD